MRDLCICLKPCLISSTTFGEKLDFTTASYIKEYANLLWTFFLIIGNTQLKLKLFKRKISFKALYPYKGTRKVMGFQKLSNKEIYFTLQSNIIVKINTTNLSDSFHGQTSLKNTIFSVKKTLMDMYFLSSINLFNFSFLLNPVIHRMGNAAKILCPSPDLENRKCFSPILYFITDYPFNLF